MTRQYQGQDKFPPQFFQTLVLALAIAAQLFSVPALATNDSANNKKPNAAQAKPKSLKPFHATYRVYAKGVPFKSIAHHKLTQADDGRMKLEMKISSFFSKLEERAIFQPLEDCQFLAHEYRHVRKGLGKNKNYTIKFDWQELEATFKQRKKDKQVYEISEGLIDRMTEQLAVQCLAAKGLEEFTIVIADKNRVKEHKFKVVGKETIETSNAAFETIKLSRVRENSSRTTTFWLATEHQYALVKMVQEKDGGDKFQLVLKTMEGDGWQANSQKESDKEPDDNQWDGTEEP